MHGNAVKPVVGHEVRSIEAADIQVGDFLWDGRSAAASLSVETVERIAEFVIVNGNIARPYYADSRVIVSPGAGR